MDNTLTQFRRSLYWRLVMEMQNLFFLGLLLTLFLGLIQDSSIKTVAGATAAAAGEDEGEGDDVDGNTTTLRIVGGTLSKGNAWPWAVALVEEKGRSSIQYCGGSILNNAYILTAAHCVYDIDASKLPSQYVYVGDHKLKGGHMKKHKFQSVTVHPE